MEGDNTPQWDSDGFVTGLDNTGTMINDLRRFLDAASSRDILVIPVLWNGAGMRNQNVINLIWDDSKLQSYIENALKVRLLCSKIFRTCVQSCLFLPVKFFYFLILVYLFTIFLNVNLYFSFPSYSRNSSLYESMRNNIAVLFFVSFSNEMFILLIPMMFLLMNNSVMTISYQGSKSIA